jgi:hypothetical protein
VRNLDQAEARTLMPGVAGAISRVGHLGMLTLIVSGSGMSLMLGNSVLSPMFIFKMLLVVLIIVFVVVMRSLAALAQRSGDKSAAQLMHAQLMKKLGIAGPVLGVLTILAAVAAFH